MRNARHEALGAAMMKAGAISIVSLLFGCGSNPSGLTKAEAEAALYKSGYDDPAIGGSPEGWSGTADRYGHTFNVVVGKEGTVTAKP